MEEASVVVHKSADEVKHLVRQAEEKLRGKLAKAGKPMAEEWLR